MMEVIDSERFKLGSKLRLFFLRLQLKTLTKLACFDLKELCTLFLLTFLTEFYVHGHPSFLSCAARHGSFSVSCHSS